MPAALHTHASRRLAALAAVGVLVCGGVAAAQTPAGKRALERAGLTRPPVAFSEIVLRRAAVDSSVPSEPTVAVAVTIHDAGPAARRYRYAVTVQPAGSAAAPAGSGTAVAAARGVTEVRMRVPLRCQPASRAYVAVTVEPEPGRSVGAWVACPQPPRGSG